MLRNGLTRALQRRSYFAVQENMKEEVGTRKIFEDERVMIWEMHLKPGEDSGLHTHKYDYMYHIRSGAKLDLYDKNDVFLCTIESKDDECMSWKLVGDELIRVDEDGENQVFPACHRAVNVGNTTFVETLVEHKIPLEKN